MKVKQAQKVAKVAPIKRTINGSKFDEAKKLAYIDLILEGKGRMMAARELGISSRTVQKHMVSSPEFKQAVSQAETEVNQKVENALYEAAMSGNVTAIQVWLYNRDPKRWNDRRNIRFAGEGGGPIEVRDVGVRNLSDEELIEIIERSRRRRATPKKQSP